MMKWICQMPGIWHCDVDGWVAVRATSKKWIIYSIQHRDTRAVKTLRDCKVYVINATSRQMRFSWK